MNSPRFTGKDVPSFALNGSTPSAVSRRLTKMAKHSESRPESRRGNSSDSGPSRMFCSCATCWNWSRIEERTLMHKFSSGDRLGCDCVGTSISSPGDSGGLRVRSRPDHVLDQRAKEGDSLEEICTRLGWCHRHLRGQDLEQPFGVLDVA